MSICLNVFFITKKSDINMIKKGIPNIIPITKVTSVLKMLAKLTYIKLIITPNKNEISGKTTNVNLISLLIHRCGRSIISLSKPSILKNITLRICGARCLRVGHYLFVMCFGHHRKQPIFELYPQIILQQSLHHK
jgi:hypothetical protein